MVCKHPENGNKEEINPSSSSSSSSSFSKVVYNGAPLVYPTDFFLEDFVRCPVEAAVREVVEWETAFDAAGVRSFRCAVFEMERV